MITIKDIISWSKPHPLGEGRMSRFGNKHITFFIVGGIRGLYSDFKKTFEVAIFDNETNNFITRIFYPEASDDVISQMTADKVEELVNSVIRREDLSIEK
jgi:hypothetical protein